ncbi:hypothetical protein Tco_0712068 [Tanacetum coccineum]
MCRLEQIIGGHRDNAHQLAMRSSRGNVVELLGQEKAAVRQDLMWVMCTAIPLMINKVIWSKEITKGMLKVLEHVMRYGRQLGECDVHDGFAAGNSITKPPCSDFSLPQNMVDAYRMFRSTS